MEKKQIRKWIAWLAGISVFVIVVINIWTDYRGQIMTAEDHISLVTKVIGSAVGLLIVMLQVSSSKVQDIFKKEVKEDITILKNDVKNTKNELDKVVLKITEADLREAERDQMFINFQSDLSSLNDKWDSKKLISELGKKIQRISQSIRKEHYNINKEVENFLIKVTQNLTEFITYEYEYGLDRINLVEYEIILYDRINRFSKNINLNKVDPNILKSVIDAIHLNINNYIKDLHGIDLLANGKRRGKFETSTIDFFKCLHSYTIEVYKDNKKTA